MDNGAAKCWGYNTFGQLGDTTTVSKSSPVQVVGATQHPEKAVLRKVRARKNAPEAIRRVEEERGSALWE